MSDDDIFKKLHDQVVKPVEDALVDAVSPSVLHQVEEALGTFPLGAQPPDMQPSLHGLETVAMVADLVERAVRRDVLVDDLLSVVEHDQAVVAAAADAYELAAARGGGLSDPDVRHAIERVGRIARAVSDRELERRRAAR